MNRTERLYALVEELRAVSPRPRTAAWLARRFDVSVRTVERDLDALRETGVAIRGGVGRGGGYFLDRDHTMPPVALTAREALAIGVALRAAGGSPFAAAARSAAQKVQAVLPADVRTQEEALAARVRRVGDHPAPTDAGVAAVVEDAVAGGRVVRLGYVDAAGARTDRTVEPLGLFWGPRAWYLVGWCRARDGVRGFALDRIVTAALADEVAAPRDVDWTGEVARLAGEPVDRPD